jgi:NitT/TauT family transport system substrate-binding protein
MAAYTIRAGAPPGEGLPIAWHISSRLPSVGERHILADNKGGGGRERLMRCGLIGALLSVLLAAGGLACRPAAEPAGRSDGAVESSTAAAPAGAAGSAPAAAAAAAVEPSPLPLRQLHVPLVSTAATMVPFWVAAEHGLFQRYGLEPELVAMPPATAAQALSAGSALIAVAGGSVVSAWVGGATDLVFVAGVSQRAPYRIIVRPEISRVEDLRGKSLGQTTPGSSPTIATIEVLRRYGLEPDRDVTLTYLRDTQATVAALATGVVQGLTTSSPQAEQAIAEGGRLLLDMRDFDIPILGPQVATSRGLVEREPDLLRRFLMAYVDGLQYARDYPAEGIAALMRGARLDEPNLAELAYRDYYDIWDPWPSEAAIQTLLDNMDVPAARTTRPAEMIDNRLVRELERSGWLAEHLRPR